MAKMLGASKPYDGRAGNCCAKHGRDKMSPKRQREDREWRCEADVEANEEQPDELPDR